MRYLKAIDVLQLKHLMPYLMQGTQNISREVDISESLCHGIKKGNVGPDPASPARCQGSGPWRPPQSWGSPRSLAAQQGPGMAGWWQPPAATSGMVREPFSSPQEQLEVTGPPWSWSSHLQPIASPSWNRAVERGIQAWPLEVINAERVLTWYLSKTPKVSPVSYWQPELIYEPQGGRNEGLVASLLLYGMCRGEDVGWALVLLVKAQGNVKLILFCVFFCCNLLY